jgi:hypothetical protein
MEKTSKESISYKNKSQTILGRNSRFNKDFKKRYFAGNKYKNYFGSKHLSVYEIHN